MRQPGGPAVSSKKTNKGPFPGFLNKIKAFGDLYKTKIVGDPETLTFGFMWAVVVAQVVAHLTMGQEVQGSNPCGSWAFSLVSFCSVLFSSLSHLSISGASLIRSLVEVQHNFYFQRKNGGLAVQLVVKQD